MVDYTALCCSADLRELMKPARGKLSLLPDNAHVHDEWYAHVASIERRNCVLFMHVATNYSVMVISQSIDNIRNLRKLFSSAITQQLNAERIGSEKQQHILGTWQAIGYRAATDKRATAQINDRIRDYRLAIDRGDGVLRCDIDEINCRLNRLAFAPDESSPAQKFANRFVSELAAIQYRVGDELLTEYPEIRPK